jgi:hypothetical protein
MLGVLVISQLLMLVTLTSHLMTKLPLTLMPMTCQKFVLGYLFDKKGDEERRNSFVDIVEI